MSDKFNVHVNDNYQFELDSETIADLDIIVKEANHYHSIENRKNYDVKLLKVDFPKKAYEIVVNGNKYKVQIKDKLDTLIQKMGLNLGEKKKEKDIKAPMPGLILNILVSEGQEVKEGDALLVLEAMKMENMLLASTDGIIKKIHIKQTEAVDKKQMLIEME